MIYNPYNHITLMETFKGWTAKGNALRIFESGFTGYLFKSIKIAAKWKVTTSNKNSPSPIVFINYSTKIFFSDTPWVDFIQVALNPAQA